MIITIDGPAGSGKSTAARELARELGFDFLDTGAMYRAIGWLACEKSIDDPQEVVDLLDDLKLKLNQDQVYMGDQNITDQIRSAEVTEKASLVAIIPEVRACLVRLQQECAKGKNIVSEGRDQGTVVFPDARFKFFLTASVETRAKRRLKELSQTEEGIQLDEIEKQIRERDERDTSRDSSPLRAAEDAITIDTSDMTIPEVVEKLKGIVIG